MNTLARSAILFGLLLVLGASVALAAAPTITSLNSYAAAVGTSITITGTGFSSTPSNNVVFFGPVSATVNTASATSLNVTVPVSAGAGFVTVTTGGLTAYSAKPFTPTFSYTGPIDTNSFAQPLNFSTGTGGSAPSWVVVADFDGDGKPDIGVVNNDVGTSSITILHNNSTSGTMSFASLGSAVTLHTGSRPWGVAAGDFDGDGKLDIAVCNGADNTVSIFHNTSTAGSISFATKIDSAVGVGPHDIVIADFDGDGKPDIAVTNYSNGGPGSFSVLRNTSTGGNISFAQHVDVTTGNGPRGIAVGVLDYPDLRPDLVIGCFDGGTITPFNNVSSPGTIAFNEKGNFVTFIAPASLAITNIDGDSANDVVVSGAADGMWAYRGDNNYGFEGYVVYHKGDGIGNILGVDINGDGKPDVVTANALETSFRRGTITLLVNKSTGPGTYTSDTYQDSVTLSMPGLPYSVAVADLDGDGKPDLIAPSYYQDALSVRRSTLGDSYTITPSTSGSGTISPSVLVTTLHGHDTTFTFTPGGGGHVDSVVIDGVNKYSLLSYTFTNVTTNHTIKVYFGVGTVFAITSTSGPNGTISPLGTVMVPQGQSQNFTITPNAGYGLDTLLVDNVKKPDSSAFTFTNVQATHSISVTFVAALVTAPLRVYLQGPATANDTMQTTLGASGALAAHFGVTPRPFKAVDSIAVELRNAQTTAGSTTRKFRPAWLLLDGTIRDFADSTKNYVSFDTTPGSYYIVVRHRNHLAVMSAAAIAMTSSTPLYDFTTGLGQAFGGVAPMIQVGTKFCMYAGDANGDGQITTLDFTPWLAAAKAASTGYLNTDMNLDGQNTTTDFTKWLANAKSAATSQVP